MNHNYYYTLLGRRAGGPGSASTSDCSGSLQLRYGTIQEGGAWSGAAGDQISDWEGLVFGGISEVWASTPTVDVYTRFFLDENQTQEISVVDGDWFRIEEAIFTYEAVTGITAITQIPQLSEHQVRINAPSATQCNLFGPYNQPVWVARDTWQQVDRIWLDQALSQPFAGGNNWYHVTDNDMPSGGTSLQVNNCGWVEGFYAC